VLAQLRTVSSLIERTYALNHEFQRILRRRTPEALDAWFAQAAASGIPNLQPFADGLHQDRHALRQALVQPYSNGISEGFVNKIRCSSARCMAVPMSTYYDSACSSRDPLRCTKAEGEPPKWVNIIASRDNLHRP
jgi:transposase